MFRDELSENSILSIMFDRSSKKLQLAGKREDVSIALKSVRRFLNENTIISKVLELPKGCRRFLAKHREQKLRQIQEELNKNSTVFKGIAECDEDGAVLDFQKKMLGPAGPVVFIFGRQNKSSTRQKLNLRTNEIQ